MLQRPLTALDAKLATVGGAPPRVGRGGFGGASPAGGGVPGSVIPVLLDQLYLRYGPLGALAKRYRYAAY